MCGESQLDTLYSAGLLGVIRKHQGLREEVNSLQKEVSSKKKAVLGVESLKTSDTLHNVSLILKRQGKCAASQDHAEQAFKI